MILMAVNPVCGVLTILVIQTCVQSDRPKAKRGKFTRSDAYNEKSQSYASSTIAE